MRTGDARPALRHVRRRGTERRARADHDARRADRPRRRRSPSRCAKGDRGADRRGAAPAGTSCPRAPTSSPTRARARRTPRAAEDFYLRTFAEPALDVNGIATGSPLLQKTVLPVEAVANVSIRLAPGQKVEEIAPEVERLLRESGARRAPTSRSSCGRPSPPGLVPPDAQAVQLGLDAFERALGRRPALDPVRRHAADRAGARRQGHPDGDHRLRPARLADPLAERAARSRSTSPLGIAPRASSTSRSRSFDRPPQPRPAGARRRCLRSSTRRWRSVARPSPTASRCSRRRRTCVTTIRRRRNRWKQRSPSCATRSETTCGSFPAASSTSHSSGGRPRSCGASRSAGNPAYLLVETPYAGWPLDIGDRLFGLLAAGVTPVLGHPERNFEVQQRPDLLEPLAQERRSRSAHGRRDRRPPRPAARVTARSRCSTAGSPI